MSGPIRTPAREELLRAEYPTATSADALLARINALPGPPMASKQGIRVWASALGLKKTPDVLQVLLSSWSARGGQATSDRFNGRTGDHTALRWTPDRVAMIRAEYPTETNPRALLDRLNAMPGQPIAGVQQVSFKAMRMGVRKTAETVLAIGAMNGRRCIAAGTLRRETSRTPEREALMRDRYPMAIDLSALLADINALPGRKIPTERALTNWASTLTLRKIRPAAPPMRAKVKPPRERRARPPKSTVPQMRKPHTPHPKQTARQTGPGQFIAPTDRPSWGHRISVAVPVACEDLSPAEQAEIVDAALAQRLASARAMIERKMAGKSPQAGMRAFDAACPAIVSATRLPHKTVRRIAGEVRMGVG